MATFIDFGKNNSNNAKKRQRVVHFASLDSEEEEERSRRGAKRRKEQKQRKRKQRQQKKMAAAAQQAPNDDRAIELVNRLKNEDPDDDMSQWPLILADNTFTLSLDAAFQFLGAPRGDIFSRMAWFRDRHQHTPPEELFRIDRVLDYLNLASGRHAFTRTLPEGSSTDMEEIERAYHRDWGVAEAEKSCSSSNNHLSTIHNATTGSATNPQFVDTTTTDCRSFGANSHQIDSGEDADNDSADESHQDDSETDVDASNNVTHEGDDEDDGEDGEEDNEDNHEDNDDNTTGNGKGADHKDPEPDNDTPSNTDEESTRDNTIFVGEDQSKTSKNEKEEEEDEDESTDSQTVQNKNTSNNDEDQNHDDSADGAQGTASYNDHNGSTGHHVSRQDDNDWVCTSCCSERR